MNKVLLLFFKFVDLLSFLFKENSKFDIILKLYFLSYNIYL